MGIRLVGLRAATDCSRGIAVIGRRPFATEGAVDTHVEDRNRSLRFAGQPRRLSLRELGAANDDESTTTLRLFTDSTQGALWQTPKTVLEFARQHDAKILDLRFTDIPGLWHHVSYPIEQLTEASFDEGFGIDGSSIRAWAGIHESDMLLKPDANCHLLDPFTEVPTLVLVCDVVDPVTKQAYDRDPRFIARKAEMYLASSGIADTAYFGAEAEFFIFDNVRFDQREQYGFYYIDAEEGRWNSGREANNLGYRPRYREGYFPVAPTDHYQDLRSEMMLTMQSCGIEVECHHHEVASGGQTEIDLKFDSLLRSADKMLLYKYIVKNVANRNGKTVTFMPKPIFGDNGSGMHTHQSLWKAGEPLFAGDGYAGLSQLALVVRRWTASSTGRRCRRSLRRRRIPTSGSCPDSKRR